MSSLLSVLHIRRISKSYNLHCIGSPLSRDLQGRCGSRTPPVTYFTWTGPHLRQLTFKDAQLPIQLLELDLDRSYARVGLKGSGRQVSP